VTTVRRGLVLGVGGVLGACWSVGALAAVEQELGWDPREADVLVGTSAGSVLAGALGNGVGVQTLLNHQRGVAVQDGPHLDDDPDTDGGGSLPPLPRPGSRRQVLDASLCTSAEALRSGRDGGDRLVAAG